MPEMNPPPPPLGLPVGSVRALLALLVVSIVIAEVVRGHQLSIALTEALMLVLALYFSTRRILSVSPAVLARLESEGQVPRERQPLFLPRFAIRILILLSFAGTAAFLFQQGRLANLQSLSSLGLVAAYLAGVVCRPVGRVLRRKEFAASLLDRFADLRALLVLGAAGTLAAFYWLDMHGQLPNWADHGALTLVLFYFGAR